MVSADSCGVSLRRTDLSSSGNNEDRSVFTPPGWIDIAIKP